VAMAANHNTDNAELILDRVLVMIRAMGLDPICLSPKLEGDAVQELLTVLA
jgi:hypothetical protein